MAKNRLPGKDLERLVAALERALADSNVRIEAPCRRLIDKDTGRTREHDVVITWDHGHHQILTAIECRDRSRPIGVPDVEAFADKCKSTGIQSGVMVSSTGFRKSALIKSESRSILCMSLEQSESLDWIESAEFVLFERHFDHANIELLFDEPLPDSISQIFDAHGQLVTLQQIAENIPSWTPAAKDRESEVGVKIPVSIKLDTTGWTAIDENGSNFSINSLNIETYFTTTMSTRPFNFMKYKGGGREYDLASAEVDFSMAKGHVVFVRNPDNTTSIVWAPKIE